MSVREDHFERHRKGGFRSMRDGIIIPTCCWKSALHYFRKDSLYLVCIPLQLNLPLWMKWERWLSIADFIITQSTVQYVLWHASRPYVPGTILDCVPCRTCLRSPRAEGIFFLCTMYVTDVLTHTRENGNVIARQECYQRTVWPLVTCCYEEEKDIPVERPTTYCHHGLYLVLYVRKLYCMYYNTTCNVDDSY